MMDIITGRAPPPALSRVTGGDQPGENLEVVSVFKRDLQKKKTSNVLALALFVWFSEPCFSSP